MNKEWVVDLVKRLPQGTVSRGWGWLARRRRPRVFVGAFKRTFVAATGIDLSEADGNIGSYSTLEDLFVRKLKNGARRVDPAGDAAVSPVDGTVGQCGKITDGTLIQAKGRSYSLARLLDDGDDAARFEGGDFATIYLAPHNYHRIHAPVSGEIREATLVPGALFPVFAEALEKVDELFARNERLVTYIDSPDAGRVAVVKVGATLVGRISVAYDPGVYTNQSGQLRRRLVYNPPRLVNKGGEVGAFELGSTVILLSEPGRIDWDELHIGQTLKMGQRIGAVSARKKSRKRSSAR